MDLKKKDTLVSDKKPVIKSTRSPVRIAKDKNAEGELINNIELLRIH